MNQSIELHNRLLNKNLNKEFYSKYNINKDSISVKLVELCEDISYNWESAYYKIMINNKVEMMWLCEKSNDNTFEYQCDGNNNNNGRHNNVIKFVIDTEKICVCPNDINLLEKIAKEIIQYLNLNISCHYLIQLVSVINSMCIKFFQRTCLSTMTS